MREDRAFIRKTVIISIIVAVLAVASGTAIFYAVYQPEYTDIIERECAKYGLDERLVYAVIKAESGWREDAVSPKGAVGLMQLMPDTAAWLIDLSGEDIQTARIAEAEINIKLGVYYLSIIAAKHTDIRLVLACYNAGENKVREWLTNGEDIDNLPYKETREYIVKVRNNYRIYRMFF